MKVSVISLNQVKENKEFNILFCPFSESCILPQKCEICKFPNYKQCPEYELKFSKLKRKLKVLH
ncbi:MAG: hypothetical protein BAJALOKI3v1_10048 [Promethearchaeota archaeon]|nr:MAG: hypothetical protein BAJALOKI3v1_10048 [Candidatus Lokiarchaeota archaeon]